MARPASRRNTLGDTIRRARAAKGLTQLQLAELADVSESTIWNIENGIYTSHQPTKLYAVAAALDLDYDDLTTLSHKRAS